MRAILAVAVLGALLVCACDDETSDGGDPTKVGSCAYVGSCSGATCVDYGGALDVATTEATCKSGGATWSTTRCTVPEVGGCLYDMGGACSIQWYTPAMTPTEVMSSCAQSGGLYVTE